MKDWHLSRESGLAEFRDCVAARSTKHLRELMAMVEAGARSVIQFVFQRTDCRRFSTAGDIDSAFGRGLRDAVAAGVELIVCGCDVQVDAISLKRAAAGVGGAQKCLTSPRLIRSLRRTPQTGTITEPFARMRVVASHQLPICRWDREDGLGRRAIQTPCRQ